MAKIKEGDKAPDFAVPDQEGDVVRLKDLRGKKVVLYFYPKDDTPGCTKEACSFRDSFARFKKRHIELLGFHWTAELLTRNSSANTICRFACWQTPTARFLKAMGLMAKR